MDAAKNFGVITVSIGYDAAATSIVLSTGHGIKLPDPVVDGEYNLVWFDSTNYTNPAEDPNVEIVRVTGPAGTGDTKTITRAQEDTTASTKNTASATYTMVLGTTAKIINDIESEIAADIATHAALPDAHHNESHTVVSHSDTTATGPELDELTDGSETALHTHASSGAPVDSVFGRIGAVIAAADDYTWDQVDKSVSDIADITDRSHTDLTDIGTNTHAQVDTHIDSSNPHSASASDSDLGLAIGTHSGYNSTHGCTAIADVATVSAEIDTDITNHAADMNAHHNEIHDLDSHIGCSLFALSAIVTDATLIDTADSRLSDSRDPNAHQASHNSGGSDQMRIDNLQEGEDNTDLDSSTSRHGLLKKLDNSTSNFMRGDGAWATPAGGGGGDMFKSVYDTDDNGVVDEAEAITSQGALATLNTVGTTQIDNSAVTNGKLADVSGQTLKGNPDIGTNPPQDMNPSAVRTLLNVADGADVTGSNPPQAHDLSGALHNNTLLAALNAKITDATLIDTGDSRLSDSRDPNVHASSHQNGGADQMRIDNLQEGEDNTDLDSSTSRHGLLNKLGGGTTNFLRADGAWAAPAGGSGCAIASGSYTGNNTANRAIPHGLSVEPKYVVLSIEANADNFSIHGNGTIFKYLSEVAEAPFNVTNWSTTNFYVGNATSYYQSGNGNGTLYYWVAFG